MLRPLHGGNPGVNENGRAQARASESMSSLFVTFALGLRLTKGRKMEGAAIHDSVWQRDVR
jgi:hypothetical protein